MKPLRLLPGFRFTPSDSELILYYLKKKVNGEALPISNLIKDRDLYGNETPSQIYESCSCSSSSAIFGDKWLYFFTKIKKKFTSGKRFDRLVGNGCWNLQKTYKVFDEKNKSLVVGYRTAFNFVVKSSSSSKANSNNNNNNNNEEKEEQSQRWIMHEYTLKDNPISSENDSIWALCKFRKGDTQKESKDDDVDVDSKRKRVVSDVDHVDDDDIKKKKKRRICYKGSSSKSKTPFDEGLIVQQQQQDHLMLPPPTSLPQLVQQPHCVGDQQNVVDEWLSIPTDDQCATASISLSDPWHSEGDEFFQSVCQQFSSGDDCDMASLSPLRTFDDMSFVEYNSQHHHQVCADSNVASSSCWNECEMTSTSSCWNKSETLTGVSTPDEDSLLAALLDNQCASNTVNEETTWSPNDWKELELMLLS